MDVVGRHHRQLVVDDVRQRLDVDATRGDVGRDEDRHAAVLEVGERADTLGLALVAVDGGRDDAVLRELERQPVRAMLGAREDERLVDPAARDEVAEELALPLAVDGDHELADEVGRRVARRDLDRGRVGQETGGELPDVVAEGRREQEALALARQEAEDLADRLDEAHVEHAIRLVQDEDLDRAEVDRPLVDVVEQPTRGRDDDPGPARRARTCGSKPTPP